LEKAPEYSEAPRANPWGRILRSSPGKILKPRDLSRRRKGETYRRSRAEVGLALNRRVTTAPSSFSVGNLHARGGSEVIDDFLGENVEVGRLSASLEAFVSEPEDVRLALP
jgi:hypothetical protein